MTLMLPLLLLLAAAQLPPVPGETTLVSFCKQGRVTACEELRKVDPAKYAEVQAELAKAAVGREAFRIAEEAAQEQDDAKADESNDAEAEGDAAPEPPDCRGQEHHVISKKIAKELAAHKTLAGLFKPRDERFKAKAKDEEAHCGYQKWHRDVDEEVIRWLRTQERPTSEQFMKLLRDIYNRPKMRERFPHGF